MKKKEVKVQALIILHCLLCVVFLFGCKQKLKSTDLDSFNIAVDYYKSAKYKKAFDIFIDLANRGNLGAQGYVAVIYQYGRGVEKNSEKAVYWYERAANSGVIPAMLALGDMYKYGDEIQKNCVKCVHWYESACMLNDTTAMYRLAVMYSSGDCVSIDKNKSNDYLKKAALTNDEYGILCKALTYYYGIDGAVDYKKSIAIYKAVLEKYNNEIAAGYLYRAYYNGYGADVNINKAMKYLQEASDLGLIAANYILAFEYYRGKHLPKDYAKALFYASKSASKYSKSAYLLGLMYEKGHGVPIDIAKSEQWFRRAASMGNEKAKQRMLRKSGTPY